MTSKNASSLSTTLNSIKKSTVNNLSHNQNKLYTKEINNLISKIIKSKNTAFHFSKINQQPPQQIVPITGSYENQNYSSNEIPSSNVKLVNSKKNTKNNNLSKSNNSSLNEASSVSLVCNNNINLKMIDYSKSMNYYLNKKNDINLSKQDILKRSLLIKDLLNFIKTEKNLSNIINEQDQFISDFIEFISTINFAHVKYYPSYKITDSNYNLIDSSINRSTIEELVSTTENNNDNNISQSMIRIKKPNWQDILNLYDIFIELLNNLPTSSTIISKLPLEFISNLVFSLQTLDSEERILIKIIIYKIYVSSLTYRKFILKNISNMLIDVSNDPKTNLLCLDECLDLLRCVILGAKKPINSKYMYVVTSVICPLLRCKNVNKQYNLKETLFKFMKYDKSLLNEIIKFVLKSWPIRYPDRIIVYLDILENIFSKNLCNIDENLLDSVFKKIYCCLNDLNFIIADRSIVFFKNDNFISCLYKYNLHIKMIKKLISNLSEHWSQEIKIISKIVINKLSKKDDNIMKNLTDKEKETINSFNYDINDSEEVWDIHFNLKGD
jgi:hypothetical protein